MILSDKLFWKITILTGIIAALIGLWLRYFFVSPWQYNFRYILHAHSHLMLLGWLLNALLLLIYRQWNIKIPRSHLWLMAGLCLCVFGMLFSFPFQGYAAVSISFSTLHILLSYILLGKIWKLSSLRGIPGKLVRAGVLFFFLSTLGPYALGPLMANNMQGSPWYDQAIFFYLHFQYNGAYLFFMLAFILEKWKKPGLEWPQKSFLWFMTIGVILTWTHNLDYSFNAIWINFAGGMGAVFQLLAGIILFKTISGKRAWQSGFIILAMLALKWIFQLMGSFPPIADVVTENRFMLIAYLHFIFLGIFTPFIWQNLRNRIPHFPVLINVYWIFFILTELALVLPSLAIFPGFQHWPELTFILYAFFVGVWLVLGLSWIFSKEKPRPQKI